MSRGSVAVITAVVAIAIGVAGCGGGSDSELSTSSLTRAEFVKKADAACTRGQKQAEDDFFVFTKRIHANLNQLRKNPNEAQAKGLVKTVMIPAIEREAAEIRSLGAPSGEEDRVEAILTAFEEGIVTAEDLPRKTLEETGVAFGIASRLASEYGLRVCGQR